MSAGEKRTRREAAEQAEAVICGVEALAKTEKEIIAALESECSRLADEFPDDPPRVYDPTTRGFEQFEPGVFRRLFEKYSVGVHAPTIAPQGPTGPFFPMGITYEVVLDPLKIGEPVEAGEYTAILRVHAGKRW